MKCKTFRILDLENKIKIFSPILPQNTSAFVDSLGLE